MAIKIEVGRGDFTSFGGLVLAEDLARKCKLRSLVIPHLPHQERKKQKENDYRKFLSLTYGFMVGADCLSDIGTLYNDPGFLAATGAKPWTAQTVGNYVNSFQRYQVRRLNESLREQAMRLRKLCTNNKDLIIDIDSTLHAQYAKKMEGLARAYDGTWGLSSLCAYDQFGFQYWIDVKDGGCYTSNGCGEAIRHIFRHAPRKMKRFLRADSGYCNSELVSACEDLHVNYVVCMRGNMYAPLIKRTTHWRRPKKPIFIGNRKAEIANTAYYMKKSGKLCRVVMIRALKRQPEIFSSIQDRYDYRAFITNLGEHEMKAEDVIAFYRKRGNAENYIKESKNGYDLHHFPCQRLVANKAYGVFAAFAHNLMRALAFKLDCNQLAYHKRIRFRMIYLAGQVVRKARSIIFRLNPTHHKEVYRWLTTTYITDGTG